MPLIVYTAIFTAVKIDNFPMKMCYIFFLIFAKNIVCGYAAYNQNVLNNNKSSEVYPGNPQFNYIKVVLGGGGGGGWSLNYIGVLEWFLDCQAQESQLLLRIRICPEMKYI